jgi:CheY-like chemotaxis protein
MGSVCVVFVLFCAWSGWAQEPSGTEGPSDLLASETNPATEGTQAADEGVFQTLEHHLSNYLHFALVGQFDVADSHAEALLKVPALDPLTPDAAKALVELTDEGYYQDAIDILLLLINNTSVSENAEKVLGLIREAHRVQSRHPERILDSIQMLDGTPTQRMVALERLRDAGEYAVPWLLRELVDPEQEELLPFVVAALPKLGKGIVNPMVQALSTDNDVVVRYVAEALGKMGYPQALPYLKQVATDPRTNANLRATAAEAIDQIVELHPAVQDLPAPDLFADLAEGYYEGLDALRADPRFPEANVWYAVEQTVKPVTVPREIFTLVMCMRCCEQAMALAPQQPEMVVLWLAANFRREAVLGLDVESDEVVETADATRPPHFPRGVYFAHVAGPTQCLRVLGRALVERDRNVALGAIAAMEGTIGPSAIMGQDEEAGPMSLARALDFPDLMVRIKSALALARVMPTQPFKGSDQVIPTLAETLTLTGEPYYLVLDPDGETGRAVVEGFEQQGAQVTVAANFTNAMRRVREERTHLDGIFINARIGQPSPVQMMQRIAEDERFGLTPVVFYAGPKEPFPEDRLAEFTQPAWRLLRLSDGQKPGKDLAEVLRIKLQDAADQMGAARVDVRAAQALALEAARVLRELAVHGHTVFDPVRATDALTQVLRSSSDALQDASLQVLSRLECPAAQRAIAEVALLQEMREPLRKAACGGLAESARQFGSHLEEETIRRLRSLAFEGENLSLRASASQAIGALDLPKAHTVGVILDNHSVGVSP